MVFFSYIHFKFLFIVLSFIKLCATFPSGFEGGMWGLMVILTEHCVSFYFDKYNIYLSAPLISLTCGVLSNYTNVSSPRLRNT